MMVEFTGRQHSSAYSSNAFVAVAGKAREMSDAALVATEFAGFATAGALLAWGPRTVEIILLAVGAGALGLWGVVDHQAARTKAASPVRLMLSGFRLVIAAVGIAAAIGAGYALVGRLMGVFIL